MNQVTSLNMGQKFKKTPIGEIPVDWEAIQLIEVADIVGGGTPDRSNKQYWDGGIPWATPTDVTANAGFTISRTKGTISDLGLKNSAATLMPSGSILMTSRATLGHVVINTVPMATNQGCANFICKDGIYNYFLLYNLLYRANDLERIGAGSTFLEIPKSALKKFMVALPPKIEQKKIAEILSAVDDVIEKTNAVIEKTSQLKTGLMQQLFTCGIDEHGGIRDPKITPEAFRNTRMGTIPKTWEVQPITNKLRKIIDYRGKTPSKTNKGVPLITAKNVREGYLEWKPAEYIASEDYERWMTRGIPNEGDVLFTTEAPLGNVALVPSGKVALAQRILTLCCEPSMLDSQFLFWLLQAPYSRMSIEQKATGTTVRGIKQSVFRKVELLFPPHAEQRRIAQIMSCLEQQLKNQTRYREHLDQVKHALMQVLLTGKVRVLRAVE